MENQILEVTYTSLRLRLPQWEEPSKESSVQVALVCKLETRKENNKITKSVNPRIEYPGGHCMHEMDFWEERSDPKLIYDQVYV